MIRKLNKTEKELTKKGIEKRKKEIETLKTELEYFEDYVNFQEKHKKYLEDKEKKEKQAKKDLTVQALESLRTSLKIAEDDMIVLKDQLKNGVEVKQPTGVN